MTTKSELFKSLQNTLNRISGSPMKTILKNNAEHSAYEVYVFSLILKAIKNIASDNKITFENLDSGKFVARGGPGRLELNRSSYALFTYRNKEYEVHIDIEVEGTSGMIHEIDISIVDSERANNCRQVGSIPTAPSVKVAFECKYYGNKLNKSLIRTYVGLLDDMGNILFSGFVSNLDNEDIQLYCSKKNRPYFLSSLAPWEKKEQTIFVGLLEKQFKKLL